MQMEQAACQTMQDIAVLIKTVKKDGRKMKKMICPTGKPVKAGLYYYDIMNVMSGFSALQHVVPLPGGAFLLQKT